MGDKKAAQKAIRSYFEPLKMIPVETDNKRFYPIDGFVIVFSWSYWNRVPEHPQRHPQAVSRRSHPLAYSPFVRYTLGCVGPPRRTRLRLHNPLQSMRAEHPRPGSDDARHLDHSRVPALP